MKKDVSCQKCGSLNDYHTIQKHLHLTAYCNQCKSYIKNLPQGNPYVMPFGKFKGVLLSDMVSKDQVDYLQWMLKQDFNNTTKDKVTIHLNSL
jgi:uncharacterized protein (DUF3820 family)